MRRVELLVLECVSETKERMSEGRLLWELMRILQYEESTTLEIIGGPRRLVERLGNARERYIHISAHGDFHKTRGTYLKTARKGRVYPSDLHGLWEGREKAEIPELVLLSACEAGHIDMVKTFSDAGCRYCIAPLHEPIFSDATVFLTLFYRLLIGEKSSPWIAFRNTMEGLSTGLPKLSGAWSFYEWGEKHQTEE